MSMADDETTGAGGGGGGMRESVSVIGREEKVKKIPLTG
jgi:hypothetical protein